MEGSEGRSKERENGGYECVCICAYLCVYVFECELERVSCSLYLLHYN